MREGVFREEIYRFNLEQGQYLEPIQGKSTYENPNRISYLIFRGFLVVLIHVNLILNMNYLRVVLLK
jgi:hypothetical protein